MTDTPETTTGPQPSPRPSDILLNLITALLAPMFLSVSGGDVGFARLAALETVTSYRSRHSADLIAIAQIIAFGLAALGSLSLSMQDDLSLSMTLRLRGNANALNRSAEQNRRAMQGNRAEAAVAPWMPDEGHEAEGNEPEVNEAEVLAQVARVQRLVAEAQAQQPQLPAAAPTTAPASASAPALDQQLDQAQQLDQWEADQAMWEAAMVDAARNYDACQTDAQRKAAKLHAIALNQLRPSPPVLSPPVSSPAVSSAAEPSPTALANQPPHHQQAAGAAGYSAALGFSASPASPAGAEVSPR